MRERQKRAAARVSDHAAEICKLLRKLHVGSGHNLHRLWSDWIASSAIAIANAVDRRPEVWRAREDEYMRIVQLHGAAAMGVFAEMFALLVEGLEHLPQDVLGSVYMALELGNDGAGQFFTPYSLCQLMASMTMQPEALRAEVEASGWITISEPAVGGGAMLIACIEQILQAGLNPSEHVHMTAVDIDRQVLMMAYIQLSLLGVPAVCVVGDTLRMQEREHWFTPVHVVGGWDWRLRLRSIAKAVEDLEQTERPEVTARPDVVEPVELATAEQRAPEQCLLFEP